MRRRGVEDRVSLVALRWRARWPRVALLAACGVVALVGLKALVRGPVVAGRAVATARSVVDVEAAGLAERFARVYLGMAPGPRRDAALARMGFADDGLAADEPGRRTEPVAWTSLVSEQRSGEGRVVVTVAAGAGGRTWYLAVTVARDAAGRLFVPVRPALVGPPAVAAHAVGPAELEVQDAALRQVATRVVRHYLAGARDDLSADLAPGAAVSLPTVALRVADVLAVTWGQQPSRVAVALVARGPGGVRLTLRYELDVARVAGRWLVRRIEVNPRQGGVVR